MLEVFGKEVIKTQPKRKGCSGKWRKISRKLEGYGKKKIEESLIPLKKRLETKEKQQ